MDASKPGTRSAADRATQTAEPDFEALRAMSVRPPEELSPSELADEYILTSNEKKLFNPTLTRLDAISREIRRRFEMEAPERQFEIQGSLGVVRIGMKNNEKRISSLYRLYKLSKLKIEVFLEKCKISMEEVESIPGGNQLIQQSRTGWRPLDAIPKIQRE